MNSNYGFIVHPENHDDLMNMTSEETGNIIKNMIRAFRGEPPIRFDDRFMDYVSDDLCGRVLRDKELSERQSKRRSGKTKNNQSETNNNQKEPNNNQTRTKTNPNTNTNTNTNTNINNNIGFKPNAFTSGCPKSDIDFEEIERNLIKN